MIDILFWVLLGWIIRASRYLIECGLNVRDIEDYLDDPYGNKRPRD